jgi:tetratricopeptide (TPR) repeat protein
MRAGPTLCSSSRHAVELAPQDARALLARRGKPRPGKSEETHADLAEALRLDPKLGIAYAVRALAFSRQGEHKSAEADATKYVALAPDAADSYDVRGGIRQAMGKHAEAVRTSRARWRWRKTRRSRGCTLSVVFPSLRSASMARPSTTSRAGWSLCDTMCPAQWYRERAASLKALGKEREARQDEKKAEKLEAEEAQEA